MSEKEIKAYFKDQVRAIIERSESSPEGFRFYFTGHEPKDEEILGLLAVSAVMSGTIGHNGEAVSPLQALRRLSPSGRSDICREFRKALKSRLRELVPA